MRSFAVWAEGYLRQDRLFGGGPWNLDDGAAPFIALRERLQSLGWQCHTHDYYQERGETPDAVLLLGIPRLPLRHVLGPWQGHARVYCALMESEVLVPRNFDPRRHAEFDGLFTWKRALADGERYHYLPYAQDLRSDFPASAAHKSEFAVMVASNKMVRHPLELYSRRLAAIRWFERRHPDRFRLYGAGWDEANFSALGPLRVLRRLKPVARAFARRYPSYAGPVARKAPVFARARFSICFENAQIPGYLTEKIFDSFNAGCVPVYWGAPDVTELIPKDCFVDFRDFADFERLYEHLVGIDEAQYLGTLERIRAFLRSAAAEPFSSGHFARAIADVVVRGAGGAPG